MLLVAALLLLSQSGTAFAEEKVSCEVTRRSDGVSAKHSIAIPTGGSHDKLSVFVLEVPQDQPGTLYFFASRLDGDISAAFLGRVKDGETVFGEGDVRTNPLHFQDKSYSIFCALLRMENSKSLAKWDLEISSR